MLSKAIVAAVLLYAGTVEAGDFSCFPREQFTTINSETNEFSVNSFVLVEKSAPSKEIAGVLVRFTMTNRTKSDLRTSTDIIFKRESGEVSAALSASSPTGILKPNQTVIATGHTLVDPGFLLQVKEICLRMRVTEEL